MGLRCRTSPWQVDRDPGADEPAGDGGNTHLAPANNLYVVTAFVVAWAKHHRTETDR